MQLMLSSCLNGEDGSFLQPRWMTCSGPSIEARDFSEETPDFGAPLTLDEMVGAMPNREAEVAGALITLAVKG